MPFFCHDITERKVRVPLDKQRTTHPSGIVGVSSLTVIVKDEEALQEARRVYDTLFGSPLDAQDGFVEYKAHREVPVKEIQSIGGARVLLRVAQSDEEKNQVEERGFRYGDVVLTARASEGQEKGRKEKIDGDLRGLWLEYV